ncbi:MAG: TetR family transcriptional regulator [Bifidobacteriaceae bacterium]|jgi:AcrR family transcriptional regulator|nr:TetR family transcriptional regulator [Bifidobacteriaceae bacterium]
MTATVRRTGRRPGATHTREQILEAARAEFAAKGFQGATTRAIADAAGVNIALLAHYFGGKQQLFAATLDLPDAVSEQMARVLTGDLRDAAEPLTRVYLGLWEDPATRGQLLAIVRSGLSDGEALGRLRELLTGTLHIATDLDPEREAGLALAMSHLLGTAVARHLTEVAPLAEMPFDELVARVMPAVRSHLQVLDASARATSPCPCSARAQSRPA